jgi:hypothetical protein
MPSLIIDGPSGALTEGAPIDLFDGYTDLIVETYTASARFFQALCELGCNAVHVVLGSIDAMPTYYASNLAKLTDPRRGPMAEAMIKRENSALVAMLDANTLTVWKSPVASHKRIYLLSEASKERVIVGSANASAAGLLGDQEEVVVYYDDPQIWTNIAATVTAKMTSSTMLTRVETLAWLGGKLP